MLRLVFTVKFMGSIPPQPELLSILKYIIVVVDVKFNGNSFFVVISYLFLFECFRL